MAPALESGAMTFGFEAQVIHWRGPSPYFFAPVPQPVADEISRAAKLVSYGWGMIPVEAKIGEASFTTSLFPRDGTYLMPLKDAVRRRLNITAGDAVRVAIALRPSGRTA